MSTGIGTRAVRVALVLSAALASPAFCQTYPVKPVHLIVAFPAGGGVDILARAISQKLSEEWSVPVVVDDRPGAGGNIGTQIVAKSAPDGYTITLGSMGTHAINLLIYKNLPYHPVRDFAPIIFVSTQPNLLAVHPSLPVKSVSDLIRLARAHPGQINYASSGNGGPTHLAGELFKTMAKVNLTHVPYKGGPPAITSVVAGETSLTFGTMLNTLPAVHSGQLRGIAVTSLKRSPAARELPTVAESGVPGYEATAWYGMFAPAGTPPDVIMKLNADISRAISDPEVRRRLSDEGAELVGGTPEQLRDHVSREIEKWSTVVKAAHMTVD